MIGHAARKMRGGGYRCLRSRLMPRYIYTSSLPAPPPATCIVTKTCNKEGLRKTALLWIEVQVGSRMWAACRSRWWPFTLSPDVTSAPTALPPHPLLVRTGSPDFLQISCSACLLSLQFLQTHVAKRRDWCKVCSNDESTASTDLLGQVA